MTVDEQALQALRDGHMAQLRHECSRDLYRRLTAACEDRPGGIQAADQDMIFDACFQEDVKADLREDIIRRGSVCKVINGRQQFLKENASVAQLRAYNESQRKLFAELRITPAKRGAADATGDDDFDAL
jgi:hypothetical protein